jgi:S-adenosylmethionine:tRNA ribosyltransferase-isomerase
VRPADIERYQTVFARHEGAVAAPTAGLHFTPELLAAVHGAGVELAWVTLHVGPGTFLPVRAEDVRHHRMEAEMAHIPAATAAVVNAARRDGRRVIAVGTTTVRALESAVGDSGRVVAGDLEADAFILPGFVFRVTDALLTNFHLPRSTLLMLVAAFAGRAVTLDAYAEAVREGYRFYSYGDAMLIS